MVLAATLEHATMVLNANLPCDFFVVALPHQMVLTTRSCLSKIVCSVAVLRLGLFGLRQFDEVLLLVSLGLRKFDKFLLPVSLFCRSSLLAGCRIRLVTKQSKDILFVHLLLVRHVHRYGWVRGNSVFNRSTIHLSHLQLRDSVISGSLDEGHLRGSCTVGQSLVGQERFAARSDDCYQRKKRQHSKRDSCRHKKSLFL